MPTIINASTTSGLVMTSDLSGQLAFQNNGTSLPMGGVAPTFSAYQSSAQSIPANTYTKVQFQTKEFDTNSNYDNVTNYRFTPTVAGYYQISGRVGLTTTDSFVGLDIYKNGTNFKRGSWSGSASFGAATVSSLMYFNGSTDYIELYAFHTSTQNCVALQNETYFQACLVRGTP
jgi:hypothetical protein